MERYGLRLVAILIVWLCGFSMAGDRTQGEAQASGRRPESLELVGSRETAEAHYNQGKLYYKRGKYDEAMEELKIALSMDPEYKEAKSLLEKARARLRAAESLERLRTRREAVKVAERELGKGIEKAIPPTRWAREGGEEEPSEVERKREKEIREFYNKGRTNYREKEYGEAIEQFQKVLALDPAHAGALRYLKRAQNKMEMAAKEKAQAQRIAIEETKRAHQEAEERVLREAEREAKEAEKTRLEAQKEAERIAGIEAEKRRKQEAKLKREAERKAREEQRAKKEAEARTQKEVERKAREEASRKKEDEARLAAKIAREEELKREAEEKARLEEERLRKEREARAIREEARTHFNEGKAHYLNGSYREAIEQFKKALDLDPNYTRAANYLERSQKRIEEAEAEEISERKEVGAKAKKEAERKAREEREAKLRAEREAERKAREEERARLEAQREAERKSKEAEKMKLKAQKEAERIAGIEAEKRKKQEAKLKREAERKAREEQRAKKEAEARTQKEVERKAREEREAKLRAQREAEQKAIEEQKAKLRAEKEAERKAKETERLARIEAEKREKQEAELKREAERKAREEEEAKLRAEREADSRSRREEIERRRAEREAIQKAKAKEISEREEAEARAKEEAERKAREEREAKLQAEREAERKAREEREAKLRAEKEAERKAKETERLARIEAEKREKQEAELKREAERKAREEEQARLRAQKEAERIARIEAEKREEQEAELKREAERRAGEEARRKKEEEAELAAKIAKEEGLKREAGARAKEEEIKAYYLEGKRLFREGRYQEAIEQFEKVIELEGNPRRVYTPSAEEYIERAKQEIEEAEARALREKVKSHYKKGMDLYREDRYEEAIEEFQKALSLDPSYTRAVRYIERAQAKIEALRARKLEVREREEAREAREEREEREARRFLRELEERMAEELRVAEERVEMRVALEEEKPELELPKEGRIRSHFDRGKLFYEEGDYPASIIEFRKVWELDPHHPLVPQAFEYIEKAYRKIEEAKRLEEAKRMEEEARKAEVAEVPKLAPPKELIKEEKVVKVVEVVKDLKELIRQAKVDFREKRYEKAIEKCELVLAEDPENYEAANLLHKAKLARIKLEEKRIEMEKTLSEKEMMLEIEKRGRLPTKRKEIEEEEKEITPLVPVPEVRKRLKEPVTVNFKDVELAYCLNFLTDLTGVNIIPSSSELAKKKKVTIKIKDMPLEDALRYILKAQGLTYRIEEDAIWVASPEEMEIETPKTRVYFLNQGTGLFAKFGGAGGGGGALGGAAQVSKVITVKDTLKDAVSWPKGSKLVLDERTGALIISNTPSNLQTIENILYNLDVTPIQVLIEARFVRVSVADLKELGIDWELTGGAGGEGFMIERKGDRGRYEVMPGSGVDLGVDTAAPAWRWGEGLGFTFAGVLSHPEFEVVLHALAETEKAKTLSCPRLTTLNNQTATARIVEEFIYPTRYETQMIQYDRTGDGDYDDPGETEYKVVPIDFITRDVGIVLNVTPSVGKDRKTITLALVPEVSSYTGTDYEAEGTKKSETTGEKIKIGTKIPQFESSSVSTSVVINDGETVVLGGLITEEEVKSTSKVPLFGDIPLLGRLFRKDRTEVEKSNLLIFVTATLQPPSAYE